MNNIKDTYIKGSSLLDEILALMIPLGSGSLLEGRGNSRTTCSSLLISKGFVGFQRISCDIKFSSNKKSQPIIPSSE